MSINPSVQYVYNKIVYNTSLQPLEQKVVNHVFGISAGYRAKSIEDTAVRMDVPIEYVQSLYDSALGKYRDTARRLDVRYKGIVIN